MKSNGKKTMVAKALTSVANGMLSSAANRRIYRRIAKKNHVSVSEIKQDMQYAINYAYQNTPNDGVTKAYQNRVPRKGTVPTVDEFLTYARSGLKE